MAVRLAQAGVLVGVLHYTLYPQARSHAQQHSVRPAPMALQRVWEDSQDSGCEHSKCWPATQHVSEGFGIKSVLPEPGQPRVRSCLSVHQC